MSDIQHQPAPTDTPQSGHQLVAGHEEQLILKSLTLPHGVGVDPYKAATLEGYDTVKGPGAPAARPDWSSAYSDAVRTLAEATKNQPPAILHAADYVLEQVARMSHYDEQRIIQARQQLAQDLSDGSFASKVATAQNAIEAIVHQQEQSLER